MMNSEYESLRNRLRCILNRFRRELLGFHLLNGILILSLYTLLYLLFYYELSGFSFLKVPFKSFLYFFFLGGEFFLGVYFLFRPLLLYFISGNFGKDFILRSFLRYTEVPQDVFKSLFFLAFRAAAVSGEEDLKKAAFIQKFKNSTENGNLSFGSFHKIFLKRTGAVLVVMIVLGSFSGWFGHLYTDLADYRVITNPGRNIDFCLLNSSLEVEYGKSFQLKMKIENKSPFSENVFICYGGGEFLMNRRDSIFTYDFDVVNNDIRFCFKTSGTESRSFRIKVLPTPEITNYQVFLIPPAYTGLKPELLKNVADFRVLYGSSLRFDISLSSVDSLFIGHTDQFTYLPQKEKEHISFVRNITASGEYALYGSNSYFTKKSLIVFNITCIPDLYPSIQVSAVQDSLRNSLFYFYGVISDDYGFSDLRFNYSFDKHSSTVMPVNIVKNITTQEFYFEFDFAEFAGMEKTEIDYYFEVFDNDNISGPKSTRSDRKVYLIPDLNTIFDYNVEVNSEVNSSLNEAEKLTRDIVAGVKELQKKILDDSIDKWEKQQLAKDIVEKKEKLDKLLKKALDENLKKSSLNKIFTRQDSILTAKQEQIQKLMDKIMDEDMKKLMEEFSKLSEEFSKDKFQNLDEKMKLSFDRMNEELDRNIELLKRYQIEEKHGLLAQQLDQLRKGQKDLENLVRLRKDIQKDSLNKMAEGLKNKLENIKNNYNNLLKDNQQLSRPYELNSFDENWNDLFQMFDKQHNNLQNEVDNFKTSQEIQEKTEEFSKEMEEQQKRNFMKMSIPEKDMELIIQNILVISLSQEELMKQFSGVSAQSARYNELGRLQDLKKLEYKIVKDSLSVLAKNNLMLASLLSDKFYDIEIKFGLLPRYIQDNKRNELAGEQQYIVSYLNDIALSLSDALQKSQSEGKGSNKGAEQKGKKGKGEGSGSGSGSGYDGMKEIQNGLKKQLENLVSQMKSGEKGKPLQQGISKMIRENEIFRKSLNDFMSENGILSPAEKQLLHEINKLLDDNIRDLSYYSVSDNLMYRNNQIYTKLLLSEKASKEREEYEEKRKSMTAATKKYKRPELYFNTKRHTDMIKTDLRKSDIKLTPFFKNMYNNYYIKLGDE